MIHVLPLYLGLLRQRGGGGDSVMLSIQRVCDKFSIVVEVKAASAGVSVGLTGVLLM